MGIFSNLVRWRASSGNVAIHPTPVVGVLGVIDDVARRVPSSWLDGRHNIYHLGSLPPKVKLQEEKRLAEALIAASLQGLLASVHDLFEGGLAQALVESTTRFNVGARIYIDELVENNNISKTAALFSETTARVLVTVGREDDVKFVGLCEQRGIPVTRMASPTPNRYLHAL